MKREQIQSLLIGYAEGSLDPKGRQMAEELLHRSAEFRNELALIRQAFAALQLDEPSAVPAHYFTNFLPNLRNRLEGGFGRFRFWIPSWANALAAPAAVAVVIVTIAGLYPLLQSDNTDTPLYSIIHDAEQEELFDLTETAALFSNRQPAENALALVSDESIDGTRYVVEQLLVSNTMYENVISDSQILPHLNEQEIQMIVDRLDENSIQ